ncbi:S-methyl-5-thioribose kinase [Amphritea balenae]|uniref:S-methyl-5-thioribose kinase n=1 Tax=Amphritea balenae TaxID=452629 RepID=A0A3P1SSK0_9GAMM|nr:S-methyl-5-thioribose kinase [Amphritea balenae]RRD00020.1 S-methyl-5-thioribose kinase [Amphritea balenae]GGK75913.1 methylthioribose kinase [Amphritea balenae]
MSFTKFSNSQQLIDYISKNSSFFSTDADLVTEEISDGNLNYVYRVKDNQGQSLIVKQTPPYIRVIGEGWPLTQDRLRIEHNSLKLTTERCPEIVPEIYHYDSDSSVILMQDIGDHHNLRELLINRTKLPLLADQLGSFLATMKFYTSGMGIESTDHKALVKNSQNPELCKIHEEVFFWDPFCDHERNDINPLLRETAEKLWADNELKREVAILKRRYMSDTEALLHGDLHTGSVFATSDSCKVIDMEFAFCGPAGFDTGVLLANFLLNYCGQANLPGSEEQRADYQAWLLNTVAALWQSFSQKLSQLMQSHNLDPSLSNASYQQWYLQQLWQDTLGYAGVEMTRRTIGIAHVADLMNIEDPAHRAESEKLSLKIAQMLIVNRREINDSLQLAEQIRAL